MEKYENYFEMTEELYCEALNNVEQKNLLLIKKNCFKAATNSEFIDFLKEKCGVA